MDFGFQKYSATKKEFEQSCSASFSDLLKITVKKDYFVDYRSRNLESRMDRLVSLMEWTLP